MSDLVTPISADEFANAHEFVKNILIQKDPTLDLSTGSALDGLVVENEAQMAAEHNARLTALDESFSLAAAAANIGTVDDAMVDSLVSNYYITRKGDTAASGPVQLIVDQPIPYQIPTGFQLTFNGLVFQTTSTIRAYPPDSVGVQSSVDSRQMTLRADNKLEFTINVTCTTTGVAGNLAAGTAMTIVAPLAGMETAVVASDFTGGEVRETNQQLLDRAAAGVTAKVLAGPEHIQATLADEFPGATCAVVGIGSPLMTRDRGNLFGLSTGGKQDIYCKTTAYVRTQTITTPGTVLDGGARQVLLPIPYTPGVGVYRVTAIRPAGAVGLDGDVPTSVTISTYTGTLWVPTIVSQSDAAFSANGVINAIFTDTTSTGPLTTGQQVSYDVDLAYMPSIEAVNTFMTSDTIRPAGQDLLVKAGVPCSVTVSATIRIPATAPAPAMADLVNAIINAINVLPFGTPSLSAYVVHKAIGTLITKGDVINTVLRGLIYAPDGEDLVLGNSSDLTIPLDASAAVGPANTFFSCAPEQVELTIVSR